MKIKPSITLAAALLLGLIIAGFIYWQQLPARPNVPTANYPQLNQRGYQTYLQQLDRTELDSIRQAWGCFQANVGHFAPADRDQAFLAFRDFFYQTINQYNMRFYENKPLQAKIYAENDSGTIDLEPFLKRLNDPRRPKKDPQLQRFVKQLHRNGLQLAMSEGDFYLVDQPDFLARNFSRYLSPSLREYLAIRQQELTAGFAEDAGLLISYATLGQRVDTWEQFLNKYPLTPVKNEATYFFQLYRDTFLSGMDNSPIADYETGRLRPEVSDAYQDYYEAHPATPTGQLVKQFFMLWKSNDFKNSPAVAEFYRAHGIGSMQGVQPPTR